MLSLPRQRALYVEGLTIEELQEFLTEQFRTFVIDPQVYVRPISTGRFRFMLVVK